MTRIPPRNPNEPLRRTEPGTTAGVLDTIADGMTLVLQRPWLMIVPLLVDVVLWLVFRVRMTPILESAARFVEISNVTEASEAAAQLRSMSDSMYASDFLGAFVPSMLTGLSLDTLMNQLVAIMSPASGAGVPRGELFEPWRNGVVGTVSPSSENPVALAAMLSLLGSTVVFALYRVPLARAIRGDRTSSLWKELGGSWVRFLAYLGLVLAVALASLVPLAVLGGLLAVMGFNLAFVMLMALLIFGSMIGIYTYFAVDAMLLHRFGPLPALKMSYDVGRVYFGQIARFALTSLLISVLSLRLWGATVDTAPGVILALVGNAYLGTALAASSMLFYTDRFRVIRMMRKRAR